MTTKELKDILLQFREMGGLNLTLTGGEIFLRKDLLEIIEFARSLYLRVLLLTNATLITDQMAYKLKKLNVADISVSIYSMNAKEHDEITNVKGSLEKTLKGILCVKKYGIPVTVKTPLMEINKYAYASVHKFCIQHNFRFITSAIIFSKSNGDSITKELIINKEDLQKILPEIKQFEAVGNKDMFEEACGSLKYMLAIDANGDVYPCNSLFLKLGNVKTEGLKEIWNSQKLSKIQNIKKTDLTECPNCILKDKCNRCPGLAYLEDGDIYSCSSTARYISEMRL